MKKEKIILRLDTQLLSDLKLIASLNNLSLTVTISTMLQDIVNHYLFQKTNDDYNET